MSNTIDLTLDGLSCGHCVKRVKESLGERPDGEEAAGDERVGSSVLTLSKPR